MSRVLVLQVLIVLKLKAIFGQMYKSQKRDLSILRSYEAIERMREKKSFGIDLHLRLYNKDIQTRTNV